MIGKTRYFGEGGQMREGKPPDQTIRRLVGVRIA